MANVAEFVQEGWRNVYRNPKIRLAGDIKYSLGGAERFCANPMDYESALVLSKFAERMSPAEPEFPKAVLKCLAVHVPVKGPIQATEVSRVAVEDTMEMVRRLHPRFPWSGGADKRATQLLARYSLALQDWTEHPLVADDDAREPRSLCYRVAVPPYSHHPSPCRIRTLRSAC